MYHITKAGISQNTCRILRGCLDFARRINQIDFLGEFKQPLIQLKVYTRR